MPESLGQEQIDELVQWMQDELRRGFEKHLRSEEESLRQVLPKGTEPRNGKRRQVEATPPQAPPSPVAKKDQDS